VGNRDAGGIVDNEARENQALQGEIGMTNTPTLKSLAERLLDREKEKREIARDCSEIKAEAKEAGFDPVALSRIVKAQLRDSEKQAKEAKIEATFEDYKVQLGLNF
jgi:uncharacterized protein (UPF0335 family)